MSDNNDMQDEIFDANDFIWTEEERKEKILKREKAKKKKEELIKKKKEAKKKKRKRLMQTIIIVSLAIICTLIFIIPFFSYDKIDVKNNSYFTDEYILNDISDYFPARVSFLKMNILELKLKNEKEYIEDVDIKYSFKNDTVEMNIVETKPVYHDNTNTYYLEKDEIISLPYKLATPYIDTSEFEQKELSEISQQLIKLPQDIFLQIKSISKSSDKTTLKIDMHDENTIYIYTNEIYDKLKYYNQMKTILDTKNKKPGNIYLDVGDYYEPKE